MTVWLIRAAAILLLGIGRITLPLPLPLPTSILCIVFGFALLASCSPWLLRKLRDWRARDPKIWVEPKAPAAIGRTPRRSQPRRGHKQVPQHSA